MNIKDLTVGMVMSYANACADLDSAIKKFYYKGYDLLVIPSRGASPFVRGAYSYAHALRSETGIDWKDLKNFFLHPEELYLPFTADIADDFPISSGVIRSYWTRVLAAIVRRDTQDVSLQFYNYLRDISGELATGGREIKGASDGRFIFVDTVISGQAVCEIFQAFNREGLTSCHFVLLIDEFGRKIKPEYGKIIQQMADQGRVTKILVDKIFTEDAGPGMSGIWSVTMPDLMVRAQELVPGLQDSVGAGLYYHEVSRRDDSSNLSITVSNAILGTMMHSAVRADQRMVTWYLEEFRRHIIDTGLQKQSVTKQIADSLLECNLPGLKDTSVSGSHVLRANMRDVDTDTILRGFMVANGLSRRH